ncbi:46 kDa FK506-binding nuclear protein-like [Mya arenaria]|uniref:46 kDa FK506-binding nuclear protein-like n=1 Tax=Mya arenaria TaxID=6604 RepID=UPI0022E66DE8|nr:46 kDa FK506-binding nuclear protein-like [Mya arenaria]
MVILKEAENMFWALVLESGQRYSQTVEKGFHISMAALELSNDADEQKKKGHISVMGASDKGEFLLCSLNHKSVFQQALDLNFNEGENVTFFINGHGTIHLTGYQLDEDEDFDAEDLLASDLEEEEEDVSDSDDEAPELVEGKRKKKPDITMAKKKMKWLTPEDNVSDDSDKDSDEELDDDDDGDDDDDFLNDESFLDMEAEEGDSDEEEESEEEEVTPAKKKKEQQKTPKDKKDKKTPGKETPKNKSKEEQKTPTVTPGGDAETTSAKKKKKKKKNKQAGETPKANGEGGQAQTPKLDQSQSKTPKSKEQSKTPKKQVLAGGTIMEEIRVGDGPAVKKGKMAHMYYVGKLQKDGRQFDSCLHGKPFRFRLGKGEVIKGWDVGVDGMKIGGKRRLTVPPQAGYGNQRSGPIPPNSTLVFEVELKNVS